MPITSNRGKELFASPFRKYLSLAVQAKARGTEVYHLNIGQPDVASPQEAFDEIPHNNDSFVPYGDASGVLGLRKALIQVYNKYYDKISYEDIIISTGASEALQFAFYACCDFGDEIIVAEPYYANYNGFAEISGIQIKAVHCSIFDDFAYPPIEEFEKLITSRTKAILLSNPNNPTGKLYSWAELQQIAQLVKKYDLFLIADEAYSEFVYTEERFHSALELEEIRDQVIIIDSFSKRYNACGIRVGMFVTTNEAVKESTVNYARLRLSPPILGQKFAVGALKSHLTYFDKVRNEYLDRRNLVIDALREIPEVFVNVPEGAFYVFAKIPVADSEAFCSWLLTDFSYQGATVMISHGSAFYVNPAFGKDEVRIAYILEKDKLKKAMACFKEALSTYPYKIEASWASKSPVAQ